MLRPQLFLGAFASVLITASSHSLAAPIHNPHLRDLAKEDPVYRATLKQQPRKLEKLARSGANLEFNKPDHPAVPGWTPLHSACWDWLNHEALILISYRANVHARAQGGWTPLHFAAKFSNLEVTDALIRAGADVNARTPKGATPMHEAAARAGSKMVAFLISKGANPDVLADTDGGCCALRSQYPNEPMSPMMAGATVGHSSVVKALLDGGADPDFKTPLGFTALHYAAAYGNLDSIRALLEAGASPNVVSSTGHTPLSLARWDSVRALLIEAGAIAP